MILVTGGTGLVGAHLLCRLAMQKKRVRAIHRASSDLTAVKRIFSYYTDDDSLFESVDWVEADVMDVPALEEAFNQVSHVYHVAAMVSFNPKDYRTMRAVNIEGTANIVNLCVANKVEKLCYVSSIATIEKKVGESVIDESGEWDAEKNNYGYAISKYGAEMEVWRASQEGVGVVIVNPGVIIGGGFWNSGSGEMFRTIAKGLPFYSNGVTGFVGVNDVVKIMMGLMESSIVAERFILVSENVSFKQVFSEIAAGIHKKKPSIEVLPFMSAIAWRMNWLWCALTGKKPVLTKQTASSIHNKHQYSSQKIKEALGIEFQSVNAVISEVSIQFNKK
ncbi:MAG: SDR family oxidoreductase [Flavobacteriaceae bacterium]|nr:SDR family oxidoreductase [Flavobacteriaceae bacterium]